MAENTTSRHHLHPVSARHLKCKVCGVTADFQLKLIVDGGAGGHGRKGTRSMGFYCAPHGTEKVAALKAGRRKTWSFD